MNKKIFVISGIIISIFLIGIISASLLTYFGKITGEVTVEGPTFYLDGAKDSQYNKYYTLKLNDDNVANGYPIIMGNEKEWFVSEVLGIDDFYDEKYNIILRMKSTHETKSGSISGEIWIGDEENNRKELICMTPIYLGISQTEVTPTLECIPQGDKGLKNIDDNEKIMLALTTDPTDVGIKVFVADSKIEVTPTQ